MQILSNQIQSNLNQFKLLQFNPIYNWILSNPTGSHPNQPDHIQSNRLSSIPTRSHPIQPDHTQSNRITSNPTGSYPINRITSIRIEILCNPTLPESYTFQPLFYSPQSVIPTTNSLFKTSATVVIAVMLTWPCCLDRS